MFSGKQDFDFAQILQEFDQISFKFAQKNLLRDTAASPTSPTPTALIFPVILISMLYC